MEQKVWMAKGHITRLTWRNERGIAYLPETVGRALRLSEEEHRIAVKYEGKNTLYKWIPHELRDRYIPTSIRTGDKLFKAPRPVLP